MSSHELDPGLLDILICPVCRSGLAVDADRGDLVCQGDADGGRRFPVVDGIPMMVPDPDGS